MTEPTPTDDVAHPVVQMDLTWTDLRFLERLTRMQVNKIRRRNEKSTYVPEPGKRHGGEFTLLKGEDMLNRLQAALDRLQKGDVDG